MAASMFLVIASRNTEWDAAATKPKATDEANEEKNPSEGSSGLVNISDSNFATVVACYLDWMVWPVMWIMSGSTWSCSCGRSCDICHWLWLWRHRILLRRWLHLPLRLSVRLLLRHDILRLIWCHHLLWLLLHWHLRLHLVGVRIRCHRLDWRTVIGIVLHERCLFVHLSFSSNNRNYKFKNYFSIHFYI